MDKRRGAALGLALTAVLAVTACESDSEGGGGGGDDDTLNIAFLLPESQTTRYESFDRPLFEAAVEDECPSDQTCKVLYSNANQDASQQQSQAEAAINNGADVLVLDPVDGDAAANIAATAKEKDIPVVAYDRSISDAEVAYYVSFDNVTVGETQAQALVDRLTEQGVTSGNIVMINGGPTDPNAKQFNEGAHNVFDESGFTLQPEGEDFFTPDWEPENAQSFMDGQIADLGPTGFVGVYAANDGTAGGAISAMQTAGINPLPPVTGQDAELAGIQRVVSGEQYMTVYKPIAPEAEKAAEVAVALAQGEEVEGDTTVNNGEMDVPSTLFDPIAVTAENVADTVVADGFWTVEDICTADYAAACAAIGLQ
ncbi:xylose-binding protein [Blastococcus aurantiacus]|uniref:Xylose-binding protein n=1 Tax=Blastococcus aurantiacus TaxID=1550231 RepID=A0A1G7HSH7_9ACTN|nr:substrate-binding domain-containing protein [Blastococcus aurantiacus]SDF03451.1 xylose-binding protein [Blastococcus aurantiacus]